MNLSEVIPKIREAGTNGCNYDLFTEDIINKLTEWSNLCKFELTEIGHDRLLIKFITLPVNIRDLCLDIYEFCPDSIEQGYGCVADMIQSFGEDLPSDLRDLTEGVDLSSEDYGLELMQRDLERNKELFLWWD